MVALEVQHPHHLAGGRRPREAAYDLGPDEQSWFKGLTRAFQASCGAAQALLESRRRWRRTDPDQVVRLWNALVGGRWSLVDAVDSDGMRFLIARKNTPELRAPTALSEDERLLASLFAFGHSTKLVAYELGLSPSTVSARFDRVLRKLKVRSRAEFAQLFGVEQRREAR